MLEYFSKYNTWLTQVHESSNAPAQVKDPQAITPDEAILFLTQFDTQALEKGISKDTILIAHALPNTQANLDALGEALSSDKLYEKLGPAEQSKLGFTKYLNSLVSNFKSMDNVYFNSDKSQIMSAYDTQQGLISRTREASWGSLKSHGEKYSYTILSLSELLVQYKNTTNLVPALYKRNALRQIVVHLKWLITNHALYELPMLFAYLENNNPNIYELLDMSVLEGDLHDQSGDVLAEALLNGLTQNLSKNHGEPVTPEATAWNDGFDIGYQAALNDLLNRQDANLSKTQKVFVSDALKKPTNVDIVVNDNVLINNKQMPITITLDNEIL